MKTIGLIGGMSWESTVSYYQAINQGIGKSLGGLHSAKVCLHSVDFAEIEKAQHEGEWHKTADILVNAAKSVEAAGADFFLICTNTMHKVAEEVEKSVNIPLIHIADATANALVASGIKKVGLLGTKFTMEQEFYKHRLIDKFDIDVIVPNEADRDLVHRVIYEELCMGNICQQSKESYLDIIEHMQQAGAQAVILGCTEIALLVAQEDTSVRLFDTTTIHAQSAVDSALA